MGNRAVITQGTDDKAECIYLHWNGGRASVEGFLMAAEILDLRTDNGLVDWDRFAELMAERFFDCEVGTTVYRMQYKDADADNYDNGVYVIDSTFTIVQRLYMRHYEEVNREKTMAVVRDMLDIDIPKKAEEAA